MRILLAIPTRDRHASLGRTLPLAAATGEAVAICDQSAQPYSWGSAGAEAGNTTLHRPDLNGLPAARNALLQHASAEVVVFLDDDTDLAANFATALTTCIARWPEAAGWGPVLETRPRAVRRLHRLVHLGCFHDPRRLTGARIDASTSALFGACFAVRREVALAVGFDARRPGYALGEDLDFCARVVQKIGKNQPFRFCRDLKAIHRCDGANRADPVKRGRAKAEFLVWFARRHGGHNPCTVLHLLLALAVAAVGHGRERAAARGVWSGLRRWWW
jgi:GT2 family glycosyltransferase